MTDTTNADRPFNQTRYVLWWIVGTATGWYAAYWLGLVLSGLVLGMLQISPAALSGTEPLPESAQLPLLFLQLATLFVIGLAIGIGQWLVLRQQVPQISRWPLFTALGGVVALFAGPYLFLLIGLGMSLLQWLILRNVLNRTGWWIIISAGAWALGYVLGSMFSQVLAQALDAAAAGMIGYVMVGIISGVLTGAALLWLLRENRVLLDGLRAEAARAQR
jgi:hypothetical protein